MRSVFFAMMCLLLVGASVRAQGTEFQLDDKGQWVAKPGRPLDADEKVMLQARELLADNKPGQAIRVLDPWIERTRPRKIRTSPRHT